MKSIYLPFISGNVSELLFRNRGRMRITLGCYLLKKLRRAYTALIAGEWVPQLPAKTSDYRISLTSYGPRIRNLPLVLLTLIQQDLGPKEIIVWLTSDDYEAIGIETRVLFGKYGICFRICEDLKSHKKWLSMIESGYQDPFVICDDDIFYPRVWFSSLLAEDSEDVFTGLRGHELKFTENGTIAPYLSWRKLIRHTGTASQSVFITGGAGAVIRPERTSPLFLDRDLIFSLCPKADDVWLNAMHRSMGIPGFKTKYSFPCLELPGTSETGLAATNVDQGGNDVQIRAVEAYFQ